MAELCDLRGACPSPPLAPHLHHMLALSQMKVSRDRHGEAGRIGPRHDSAIYCRTRPYMHNDSARQCRANTRPDSAIHNRTRQIPRKHYSSDLTKNKPNQTRVSPIQQGIKRNITSAILKCTFNSRHNKSDRHPLRPRRDRQ